MIANNGFIHEKIEIKLLILYVLKRLPEAVPLEVLVELTLFDKGITYFDITECVQMLVETNHILFTDGKYALTPKGERNGEALEQDIPFSVREKAELAASRIAAGIARNAMIKTSRTIGGGSSYKVLLSLSDGVGEILSMEIYAANEKQADKLEKGFRRQAENIYNNLIKSIIGE